MKTILQKLYLIFTYFLLYIPILALIIYSVNEAKYSLQWQGFSLQWYSELFQDNYLWRSFLNSVVLGLSASTMATSIGLLAAIHLFLFPQQKPRLLEPLLLLLIILPDLILAVALLLFFNLSHIPFGFLSLLIAHITICLPFVVITINGRLQNLDPNLYFSALDLGASRMLTLKRILLPLLWPAVLSAFLLSFTLSFDDVIISYFVAGADFPILPLTIYSLVRAGVTPELNALCSIIFLISMLLVVVSFYLSKKANS